MSDTVTLIDLFGGNESAPVPDPYSVYDRLRVESPVLKLWGTGYEGFLITRHADVVKALVDDDLFSSKANHAGIGFVIGRTVIEMDGREHTRHRQLITPYLAPRALRGDLPGRMEKIAHDLIDRFVHEGRADLVEAFTFTFPLRVFVTILGLPVEDYDQVHRWAIDLTRVGSDPVAGMKAAHKLGKYFEPVIESRRREPTGDMVSQLVHAEIDGERLTNDEVTSFLRLLVIAGAETTYHLIGNAMTALLRHPDVLDEVRTNRELLQPVMDETLRWEGPVQLVWRENVRPTTIAGYELEAGSRLLLSIGSANRDPAVFDRPAAWDLRRDTSAMLGFGQGRHFCAGSRLAYAEARVAMEALFDRLPDLRLARDGRSGIVGLAFRGPEYLDVEFTPAPRAVAV